MRTKVVCLFMCVCLLVTSMVGVSSNASGSTPAPALTYFAAASSEISFSGERFICSAWFCAYDDVDRVNVKMYLEKKGFLGLYWSEVESVSHTFYVCTDICERQYYPDGNGTYRVRAVYTAYCGSNSESITTTSREYSYSA